MQETDETIERLLAKFKAEAAGHPPKKPPLPPSGAGGTYDDMEGRLAKLESDMEYVKRDVGEMRPDVAKLKTDVATLVERVGNLPTKEWTFKSLAALLVAISVIVGLIVRFIPHAG
jgi:hypothetical protein